MLGVDIQIVMYLMNIHLIINLPYQSGLILNVWAILRLEKDQNTS